MAAATTSSISAAGVAYASAAAVPPPPDRTGSSSNSSLVRRATTNANAPPPTTTNTTTSASPLQQRRGTAATSRSESPQTTVSTIPAATPNSKEDVVVSASTVSAASAAIAPSIFHLPRIPPIRNSSLGSGGSSGGGGGGGARTLGGNNNNSLGNTHILGSPPLLTSNYSSRGDYTTTATNTNNIHDRRMSDITDLTSSDFGGGGGAGAMIGRSDLFLESDDRGEAPDANLQLQPTTALPTISDDQYYYHSPLDDDDNNNNNTVNNPWSQLYHVNEDFGMRLSHDEDSNDNNNTLGASSSGNLINNNINSMDKLGNNSPRMDVPTGSEETDLDHPSPTGITPPSVAALDGMHNNRPFAVSSSSSARPRVETASSPQSEYPESVLSEDISTSLTAYYRSGMAGYQSRGARAATNPTTSTNTGLRDINDTASVSSMDSYGYSLDGYAPSLGPAPQGYPVGPFNGMIKDPDTDYSEDEANSYKDSEEDEVEDP